MTNLLELVPSFERHLRAYIRTGDTESKLSGYLADAIQALSIFWPTRGYTITYTAPYTYVCPVTIAPGDFRPIILMGSIIYKQGNINLAAVTDGDFSYNPFPRGQGTSTLAIDITELEKYIPRVRLASASTVPMVGFDNIYNRESYVWWHVFTLFR